MFFCFSLASEQNFLNTKIIINNSCITQKNNFVKTNDRTLTNRDLNGWDNYSLHGRFFILGNCEYAMVSKNRLFYKLNECFG